MKRVEESHLPCKATEFIDLSLTNVLNEAHLSRNLEREETNCPGTWNVGKLRTTINNLRKIISKRNCNGESEWVNGKQAKTCWGANGWRNRTEKEKENRRSLTAVLTFVFVISQCQTNSSEYPSETQPNGRNTATDLVATSGWSVDPSKERKASRWNTALFEVRFKLVRWCSMSNFRDCLDCNSVRVRQNCNASSPCAHCAARTWPEETHNAKRCKVTAHHIASAWHIHPAPSWKSGWLRKVSGPQTVQPCGHDLFARDKTLNQTMTYKWNLSCLLF